MRGSVRVLAALLVLLAGCGGPRSESATPTTATTTTTAITVGDDPTKATTTTTPLVVKVVASLRAHGFEVTGVRPRDVGGGELFGMKRSYDARIDGNESFINVFASTDRLSGWLETAGDLGGVIVFSTTDVWAISLDTDDAAKKARSARLATKIGRELYADWNGSIRTIGTA